MSKSGNDGSTSLNGWRQHEQAIFAFEQAWQSESQPEISAYLEDLDAEQRRYRLAELIKVDLEYRWRHGETPVVEMYLQQFSELRDEPELIRTLVEEEIAARRIAAKLPTPAELTDRFPEFGHSLQRLLQTPQTAFEDAATQRGGGTSTHPGRIAGHEDASLSAGCMIDGRYELELLLGQGSFATVWKAGDRQLERDVAIKLLRSDLVRDASATERIHREAMVVARLGHASVVPVYEVGLDGSRPYIVSQYIDGPSLEEWLKQHTPSPREVAGRIQELAEGLDHAHRLGIVHRDVKPANVLVAPSGRLMMTDFGLAHLDAPNSATLTRAGDLLGTPAYMSPEQARGEHHLVDPRTDIYALGVILYRTATGALPYLGTATEVLRQVMQNRPAPPRKVHVGVDRDMATIIERCMEPDLADRYHSAADLAADLGRYADGEPIHARPVGLHERIWKWGRRRPRIAALVLATVLLAGFLAGTAGQLRVVGQQRDRAQEAEQRASEAQQQTQRLLAQASANGGELAMQRGQLVQAIAQFDRGLELGYEDPQRLRLWRVGALIATRQIEEAADAMKRIGPPGDSGKYAGERLLLQAELALEGFDEYGNAEALFEKALLHELLEADRAYANGMLAETTPQAIERFAKAIELSAIHHRSHRMLIAMLVASARFDEADLRINMALQLFPEDDEFRLLRALVRSGQGRRDDATQILGAVRLDEQDRRNWESMCQAVYYLTHQLEKSIEASTLDQVALANFFALFANKHLPMLVERGWHFPPGVSRRLTGIPDVFRNLLIRNRDGLDPLLASLLEVHPEGTLYVLLGELRLARDDHPAALAAFEAALEHEFFVGAARHNARLGIAGVSMLLGMVEQVDTDRHLARFGKIVREIDPARIGDPAHCRGMVITLLNTGDLETARPWVNRWVELSAGDPADALWHLMVLEQQHHNSLATLRVCDRLLTLDPENESVQSARQAAMEEIRAALEE